MADIDIDKLEDKIRTIIAEMTGIDPEEIKPDVNIYKDLGIEIGRASCRERV